MSDPGWDYYRSFRAVLREGSLSAAARQLNLTQPTIGRHIDALEQALGVPLFIRSAHGLTPTKAARDLLPHAEAMASAAEALQRAASADAEKDSGTVRVTASEVVGVEVLPPILAVFRALHPRIDVELVVTNRTEDLSRHEADIAVRMARPAQDALIAKRIGAVKLGLFAHRRYIDRHGVPKEWAELQQHDIIGFDRDPYNLRLARESGITATREIFALRTDSDLASLAAIRAGFGIGVCQIPLGRRDNSLVQVLRGQLKLELEMWLAMHEDLKSSLRVRLMFDHLSTALRDYVAD